MHFDKQAQDWDNDPAKIERAEIFAKEINTFVQPKQLLDALEFGCGTGLLSFQLKDFYKTITLVDNSKEMINVLQEKIEKAGIKNFKPIHITSLDEILGVSEYDVIYTLMTLHHISDVDIILKAFYYLLKTGGYLCIADLVQEDGSFHSNLDNFKEHNGFDREELSVILSKNGFNVEHYKICYEVKKCNNNKIRSYPLFLMICKKMNVPDGPG
jgi:2-polyprenyl-3-methyl-5-hydroxy-6-metoxy-1,4-benzoquinol methylase